MQAWRHDAKLSAVRMEHAHVLADISDKARAAADQVREREGRIQAALAAADDRHTRELAHAKTETDRLRACIRAGTCGVRIVTVAARDNGRDRPQDAAPGCVGDAAGALDAGVAERVLDLRDAIAADAAALGYLQEYARQCAGAAHAE